MTAPKLTKAQQRALAALVAGGGNYALAALAPLERAVLAPLAEEGLVEVFTVERVRVTPAGRAALQGEP